MNRVLVFFLLLVLSVACVGAVAGVEAAAGAVLGESAPGERPDAVEAREGLGTTQGRRPDSGSSGTDGDGDRDNVPKDPKVDVDVPKVELEQTKRGAEERYAVDTQEGRTPPERGNQAGTGQNHQPPTSVSETSSTSSDPSSPPGSSTTSRPAEPISADETMTQQNPSGAGAEHDINQRDNVQGGTTQNTHTTRPERNDGHDTSASTTQSTGDNSSSSTATDEAQNNQAESDPNVATPAEGESNSEESTTTTTLPPELTNNKKGDADSSSSISSSVWVRVPLLIVVTLTCILMC
ncbi:uncharacterized protein TM35_000471680 [Trypanosoma theileri]|uniref:Mucin TcMUCII n=1 Tax=Trypanosoma theileri TaxID=67003 RepID=A0A1X0NIH5_9TRYP|nr:uncharacterized protein TM35_000471680 [Trypanosoma theileri]ORC84273.1 hypothetical protein TM35_000471680 [Trypanosoma theileri]